MRYKHKSILEFINSCGITKLVRSYSTGAIKVVKPFYVDDTLILQIVSLGAGLSSIDTVEMDIILDKKCKVILINQSATKILTSSDYECSNNSININVGPQSTLELYSGLIIPFPDSAFVQNINVNLSEESKFGYMEILSLGRIQKGEDFLFRRLSNNIFIKRENKPVFWENYSLSKQHKNNLTVMGKYKYLATGIWTYELSDSTKGFEKFDGGLVVWGRNEFNLTFIKGVAENGHLLIKKVCDLVDIFKMKKNETLIHWQRWSSAFL